MCIGFFLDSAFLFRNKQTSTKTRRATKPNVWGISARERSMVWAKLSGRCASTSSKAVETVMMNSQSCSIMTNTSHPSKQIPSVINGICWLTIPLNLFQTPMTDSTKKMSYGKSLSETVIISKQKMVSSSPFGQLGLKGFESHSRLYVVRYLRLGGLGPQRSRGCQAYQSCVRRYPSILFNYLITIVIYRYDAGINTFDTANVSIASEYLHFFLPIW